MQTWVRDGDSYRCKRHPKAPRFDGAETTCAECDADPGELTDLEVDAPLSKPPRGCESSVQHERALSAIAAYAMKQSRVMVKTGLSAKTHNAAAKWADIAVKARRAAAAAAIRREDEEIVSRREKRQRARDRGVAN